MSTTFKISLALLSITLVNASGCKKNEDTAQAPPIEVEQQNIVSVSWPTPSNKPEWCTDLPFYNELNQNYAPYDAYFDDPSYISNDDFAEMVGGRFKDNVMAGIFTYTCASRVSHALNKVGHNIPAISGQTVSGRNGEQIIYRVAQLESYLEETYGPANIVSNNITDFYDEHGIIVFRINYEDAYGHATLWNGDHIEGGNHETNYYFDECVYAKLWICN